MPGEHAKLSPSAAHRWMSCPGSIRLSEGIPETSSVYADEGTMLHDIVADCLRHNLKPGGYKSANDEYAELINGCLRVFWDRFDPSEDVALIERRVYFPHLPDVWGTADVIIIGKSRVETIDWKFGRGVPVEAVDNPQLEIYMLAAHALYDFMGGFDTLIGTIYQPRLATLPREWSIPVGEVGERATAIKLAADRTRFHQDELHDGDWCQFCPAKSACPKLRETALVAAAADFTPIALTSYSGTQVAEAMDVIPRLQQWMAAIQGEALARLQGGEVVGDYKLVEGRRSRAYADPAKAERWARGALGDDGFTTPVLLSVAQLEKAAKLAALKLPDDLVEWKDGATHVAPGKDRRESKGTNALAFEAIDI